MMKFKNAAYFGLCAMIFFVNSVAMHADSDNNLLLNEDVHGKKTVYSKKDGCPYELNVVMENYSSEEGDGIRFRYWFSNNSGKDIEAFSVICFIFDDEGESPLWGRNNVSFTVRELVKNGLSVEGTVSAEKYFEYIPDEPYDTDWSYVSRIIFDDGSKWTDPFGKWRGR